METVLAAYYCLLRPLLTHTLMSLFAAIIAARAAHMRSYSLSVKDPVFSLLQRDILQLCTACQCFSGVTCRPACIRLLDDVWCATY